MPALKNLAKILLPALVLALFWPQSIIAVENPVTLPATTVSARVEPTPSPSPVVGPTSPILISPVNNAFINSHYMTFCFKKSTSPVGSISYYQLFIQGALAIDQIPPNDPTSDRPLYSLTTNGDTICIYYKKYLDDGPYTWKVRAYDNYTNFADSATWLFNVDTVPASITITRINENDNLNLTTDVPASIPDGLVIETISNYPQFCGKTESSITVQISLTGSEDSKLYLLPKTTSNSDGSFCITSDQYIPSGEYKVNILASDQAGNTAVMKEFSLLITAKGKPPIITPTELISKTLELIGLSPAKPQTPQEQLLKEELEQPQQLLQLPAFPIAETPYMASLFLVGLLLFIIYLTLISYGLGIIPCLMPGFLWFLLWPFGKPKSIAYCSLHKIGLSFTTIKIFKVYQSCSVIPTSPGHSERGQIETGPSRGIFSNYSESKDPSTAVGMTRPMLGMTIIEEVFKIITDIEGKFKLKLANGVWKLKACRPGFMFPSLMVNGSSDGKFTNIYHDEYIEITDNGWQLVLPELMTINHGVISGINTVIPTEIPLSGMSGGIFSNYQKHKDPSTALGMTKAVEITLALPLDPQPRAGKYQKAIFCAKLIGLFLGLWAIVLFILIPSWLSLGVFILFGIIAIRTLEIH